MTRPKFLSLPFCIILVFATSADAQNVKHAQDDEKAWAAKPKEIAFQNDSQWQDNRWQLTDLGPCLTASISSPKGQTMKGIAIRVGGKETGNGGQAAVCFDTARLRYHYAWGGEFLRFDPRRFGLIRAPAAGSDAIFWTKKSFAGWAKDGRFEPKPDEITWLDTENGYTAKGSSVTCLPKDWASYKGMYLCGNRTVLSYTVGKTEVLDSPWYVEKNSSRAMIRNLSIKPSDKTLQLRLSDSPVTVNVLADSTKTKVIKDRGATVLEIPARNATSRIRILIAAGKIDSAFLAEVQHELGSPTNLEELIKTDSGRFPQELKTRGTTTESDASYVIDTLTVPYENPFNALFFTAGHDFFSDGRAAICTTHGDVWTVSGIDQNLKELTWRRFATGLFQPLGLRIVDDKVYVLGRDQITRLHDRNLDGEADWYENFNNELFVCPKSHDYVTCLDTDREGNFYFIHAKTGVMRVSPDGRTLETIADGFRNPNGMGVSPDGMITAAPQQGGWTPESSLIAVEPGGYYGFGGPRVTDARPTGWDLPMCFIPRALDNSGGGQVWTPNDKWGLPAGQMLHLSYGQCRILMALTEKISPVSIGAHYQGGTIQFPTEPGDFLSGIMRARFSPHDGQLYLSGLRGWQTRAIRDGCFQRLRYTGKQANLPVSVNTYSNGLELTFTKKLDRNMAENADNFFVEQWNYLWSAAYGSPEFSVERPKEQTRDPVEVVSATLSDDGKSLFLEMPNRKPVHQMAVNWLLKSDAGDLFRGTYAHTINTPPKDAFAESKITRRPRIQHFSDDAQQRMEPGLQMTFVSKANGESDSIVSRLAMLRRDLSNAPTPFLPTGPFDATMIGALLVPRSGFYQLRVIGSDDASLEINGETMSPDERVLLSKGFNRFQLEFKHRGDLGIVKHLAVEWKGHGFDWEPISPEALYHDRENKHLVNAKFRRLGRELFVNHQCIACHKTELGESAMFETSLLAPELADVGNRLNPQWVASWILDPKSMRRDATMPRTLGPNAKQDAADIAAYLASHHSDSQQSPVDPAEELDGESLYETLACISCHRFTPPTEQDDFSRVSLHYVAEKYRLSELAEFLKRPTRYHAATKMPEFKLTDKEAQAIAQFVRDESRGRVAQTFPVGNVDRGRKLFDSVGCNQCHAIGELSPRKPAYLAWKANGESKGCLAGKVDDSGAPRFDFSHDESTAINSFLKNDRASLKKSILAESSIRLTKRLGCANCHDRDGIKSHRPLVVAEEGSGKLPEVLPALTWSGEKLRSDWVHEMLAGKRNSKSRPWLKSRMPAFPAYARAIAEGLAVEHGVTPVKNIEQSTDPKLIKIGEQLTLQSGLDCRQCHAIGDIQPRGDKDTKIALGINFVDIRDRMRKEAYHRFMINPPRFDVNTKMIKLSENGLTTKLKNVFDADAKKQFEAVWQYMQTVDQTPNE